MHLSFLIFGGLLRNPPKIIKERLHFSQYSLLICLKTKKAKTKTKAQKPSTFPSHLPENQESKIVRFFFPFYLPQLEPYSLANGKQLVTLTEYSYAPNRQSYCLKFFCQKIRQLLQLNINDLFKLACTTPFTRYF